MMVGNCEDTSTTIYKQQIGSQCNVSYQVGDQVVLSSVRDVRGLRSLSLIEIAASERREDTNQSISYSRKGWPQRKQYRHKRSWHVTVFVWC